MKGSFLTVDYEGSLGNGYVFDSSFIRGEPFSFTLGRRQVIEGWERGLGGKYLYT